MKRAVFINGRFLTQLLTGVQRYSRELVSSLDRLIQQEPDTRTNWTLLCPERVHVNLALRAIRTVTVRGLGSHFWEQGALAYAARGGVLVSLGNSGPLCHRRHLVVIHDASVFRTPENYSWQYATAHRSLTRLLARSAHLATVSHFSQRELAELLGLRQTAIAIVPDGVDHVIGRAPDRSIVPRLGLSGSKYLLCVGSLAPNKNLARAVKAFHATNESTGKMVIVGGLSENVFRHGLPEVSDNIVIAGRVSDEELIALYQNAIAFVFPSLYEGFGIPPLEAMAHGCPVLASDIEPILEVCADAAIYFDPFNISQMATVFKQALGGAFERDRLIENGKRQTSVYNWRTSAQALQRAIYRIAGE
jgi:glycosyltransferase involved in cell wall biosynthesis